jgi:hypothetical protein
MRRFISDHAANHYSDPRKKVRAKLKHLNNPDNQHIYLNGSLPSEKPQVDGNKVRFLPHLYLRNITAVLSSLLFYI